MMLSHLFDEFSLFTITESNHSRNDFFTGSPFIPPFLNLHTCPSALPSHTNQPTPTLSYTISVMGAGGGVLLASRCLFMEPQASSSVLQVLLEPPPMGWRVCLRAVVGLCFLGAVKSLAKPLATTLVEGMISAFTCKAWRPATTKKGDDRKGEGGLRAFTSAELLVKYLNYFAVGWCVIGVIPAMWLALGL
eukprot:evm.model.NODE_16159_length_32649_cov_71.425774.5